MGLRGEAAIVGYIELPPERMNKAAPAPFTLEQWAELSAAALDDAGIPAESVNGIVTSHLGESEIFVPSTVAEYLGVDANFAELLDLGGASAAGMVWRAAAAVELGLCDVVLCTLPARYITQMSEKKPKQLVDAVFFGSSSNQYGSPQAEFDIPYGNLGQNGPYGQVAQRYGAVYGYDERAMAKIVVDQRFNANHTEGAIWKDKPLTVDDVLASPVIADPLHMLEIVMPCVGGAAVVVANADIAKRARNRPVWIKGFGEHVPFKTPTYAQDLLRYTDQKGRRHRVRYDEPAARRHGHGVDLRLLHHHRAAQPRGRRVLREGQGHGIRRRPRPDVPRRLPAQHRGRPAGIRPGRSGRWHAPRVRRHPSDHGPSRRGAGRRLPSCVRLGQRRNPVRADHAHPRGRLTR